MEYYGIMLKRRLLVKIGAILFGIYSIYNSIINHNLFYLPFGIIIIIATFSDRKHVISEKGVDIVHTVFKMQFHSLWNWNDINTIHIDLETSNPNVELHFGKDIAARRIILFKNDADKIINFAKKVNSKIYISKIKRK